MLSEPQLSEFSSIPLTGGELVGYDIASHPQFRGIWWPEGSAEVAEPSSEDLPTGGFASPWGYWFCPAGEWNGAQPAIRVSVRQTAETSSVELAGRPPTHRRPGARLPQRVSISLPDVRDGELELVISEDSAQVFAAPLVWEMLAEPMLLVIAQYVRYASMERSFLAVQNMARREYRHASTAGLRTLRQHRRLMNDARAVRDLVSDWTYFSGPCSDAYRTCSSQASLDAYSDLAADLDFEGWAESIDAMAEDVEQTYEVMSDKLFHYRLFMWGMGVETVVVGLITALILR